ncbi:hypothetical protein HELRODRAFT_191646 [Helobdella robusta]|uniref:Uncharacterized protein n=1 Tax=Helobdella robusta TaxID=6412 RepID=T1FT61_HELRO|nr:hypothetical protein HELRODRAFT_191646 [Helobdella robusta]ESO04604.1 hypothetical protein HELRODRAFT_191646 [Helobdella robusta]
MVTVGLSALLSLASPSTSFKLIYLFVFTNNQFLISTTTRSSSSGSCCGSSSSRGSSSKSSHSSVSTCTTNNMDNDNTDGSSNDNSASTGTKIDVENDVNANFSDNFQTGNNTEPSTISSSTDDSPNDLPNRTSEANVSEATHEERPFFHINDDDGDDNDSINNSDINSSYSDTESDSNNSYSDDDGDSYYNSTDKERIKKWEMFYSTDEISGSQSENRDVPTNNNNNNNDINNVVNSSGNTREEDDNARKVTKRVVFADDCGLQLSDSRQTNSDSDENDDEVSRYLDPSRHNNNNNNSNSNNNNDDDGSNKNFTKHVSAEMSSSQFNFLNPRSIRDLENFTNSLLTNQVVLERFTTLTFRYNRSKIDSVSLFGTIWTLTNEIPDNKTVTSRHFVISVCLTSGSVRQVGISLGRMAGRVPVVSRNERTKVPNWHLMKMAYWFEFNLDRRVCLDQ